MKTYTIEGVPCVEIHRTTVRQYLGVDVDICHTCPAYSYNSNGNGGCALVEEAKRCPVDEILVPVDVTRSPEFIAALLEN